MACGTLRMITLLYVHIQMLIGMGMLMIEKVLPVELFSLERSWFNGSIRNNHVLLYLLLKLSMLLLLLTVHKFYG